MKSRVLSRREIRKAAENLRLFDLAIDYQNLYRVMQRSELELGQREFLQAVNDLTGELVAGSLIKRDTHVITEQDWCNADRT